VHDLAPAITTATGMRWSDELSDLVYQYCTLRMRVRVRRARTASRRITNDLHVTQPASMLQH